MRLVGRPSEKTKSLPRGRLGFESRDSGEFRAGIRTVRGNYTEENVLEELNSNNYNNVKIIKISKINFDEENPNKYHFLVQISHDSQLLEFTKTKHILYQSVKWEHLKKRKNFQCKNCQRLGHASSNCNLKYRCVNCSQNHTPGECPIIEKINNSVLKCANCGQTGHPASYRGRPYIKNVTRLVQMAKKKSNQKATNNKIINIERKVRPGLSYSAVASSTNTKSPILDHNVHKTTITNSARN